MVQEQSFKRSIQYIYVMFSLKVAYKGKNILLGKSVDNMEKIAEELNSRFLNEFQHGVVIKYQDRTLKDFAEIQQIVESQNLKSLKVDAEAAQPRRKSEIKKVVEPEQNIHSDEFKCYTEEIFIDKAYNDAFFGQPKQEQEKITALKIHPKPQIFFSQPQKQESLFQPQAEEIKIEQEQKNNLSTQIPVKQEKAQEIVEKIPQKQEQPEAASFYNFQIPAYVSEIKQEKAQNQKAQQPERLHEGPELTKLINDLVDKKVNEKMAELEARLFEKLLNKLKLLQSQQQEGIYDSYKSQSKAQEKPEIEYGNDCIDIQSYPKNFKEFTVNEEFEWTFAVTILHPSLEKEKIAIFDLISSKVYDISITSKKNLVSVGKFSCVKEGKFDRQFRCCLISKDGKLKLIGPKFGFSANIKAPAVKKVLTTNFREKVDSMRKAYKAEKPTEYLIEKLKEMGITQENFDECRGMIGDIIVAL